MGALDDRLRPMFAAQRSLVSRRQVFAVGGSDGQIHSRVRSGQWERPLDGVYGINGVEWTWHRSTTAVGLAVPTAVLGRRAAAKWIGAGGRGEPPIEFTTEPSCQPRRDFHLPRPGGFGDYEVLFHESDDLCEGDWYEDGGIRVSTPLRIAADIGTSMRFNAYRKLLSRLVKEHGLTWEQLDRLHQERSEHGRHGMGPLGGALDLELGIGGWSDSELEIECADVLIGAGLTGFVRQHAVTRPNGRIAYLDIAYLPWRVAAEPEGPHHREAVVDEEDAERHNDLVALGWQLVYLKERHIRRQPAYVADAVRAALRARGAPV